MTPRREFLWVAGYNGDQVAVISNPLDFHVDERFAQSETLYFSIRADDPKAAFLLDDVEIRWRGRRFYISEHIDRREGSTILVDVEAPALWNRLAGDKRVGTLDLAGYTTITGLSLILDGSGWNWEILDPDIDNTTLWTLVGNDASVLDLVRKWAKITGTEVAFDTIRQTVSLVRQLGVDRGVGFRYARNVRTILRRSSPPPVTRLYPFGKDGLEITRIAGAPYIEDFTFYTAQGLTLPEAQARYTREEVWTDSSFVVDADLYAAALERLAAGAQPLINYELSVVDLSDITHVADDRYALGDAVRVTDEPLGFNVRTRVVRIDRFPLDPANSLVELSYLAPSVPDPDVGGFRSDPTSEWVLFETRTSTPRRVRIGSTILGRLNLTTVDDAEWVVGYSLIATAVGAGTLTISATDDLTAVDLFPPIVLAFTDGQQIKESFTFGERDIDAGGHKLTIRAHSTGSTVGVDVIANGSAFWVLAKGTIQQTLVLPTSIRFDYTAGIQTFTVPDDVSTITIDAHGAIGGNSIFPPVGGNGGRVTATFPVIAGTVYDVYVGGHPTPTGREGPGGWPNGGSSPVATNTAGGGGGSSHVVPTGLAVINALIVAGGGGGAGTGDPLGNAARAFGGAAGYYNGSDGGIGRDAFVTVLGGGGATQLAGGVHSGVGGAGGTDGTAMQGGDGAAGGFPNQGGGGAGGGWFGGGGGGLGSGNGAGGGGGSGWISAAGYDLDITDNENAAHGYVVISWDAPLEP